MKVAEGAQCAANGVNNMIELKVGVDGLAVATGTATQFPGLTTADIYKALAATPFGKPQTAKTWKRSEEHTSELQSLMRISYAVFCLKKKTQRAYTTYT